MRSWPAALQDCRAILGDERCYDGARPLAGGVSASPFQDGHVNDLPVVVPCHPVIATDFWPCRQSNPRPDAAEQNPTVENDECAGKYYVYFADKLATMDWLPTVNWMGIDAEGDDARALISLGTGEDPNRRQRRDDLW